MIELNKYDQTDYTSVTSIALCKTEGKSGCDPSIAYVVRHPEYNPTTSANDIALIFLPWDITYVPHVELNRDANFPTVGQNLEVFGWGLTNFTPTAEFPIIVQTITVQALANQDFSAFTGATGATADVMCATIEGKGAWQGDSGTCISWAEVFYLTRCQS